MIIIKNKNEHYVFIFTKFVKTSVMDLKHIIENTIINSTRHQDYEHVNKLREKYIAFITNKEDENGEQGLNKYLKQFVRREDTDLFEQRKNLTKHQTPSICAQLMKPFNKVIRSNRVVKLIDHKDAKVVTEIEKALVKFYGESGNNGVDQFLNERFLPLTFTDPNAWLWITFNPFDGNLEKPQTFPVEYSSESVINYSVKNDQTEWVIVHLTYTYISKHKDENKTSDRFIIFGDYESFEYKLIPDDIKESFLVDGNDIWEHPKTKKRYVVYKYEHKSNRVPLMRVGYRKDIATKSRTFVNPFHYEAMPLLEQFIKVSSELQLSITLHAFPKQVSYVSVCEAKGCSGGTMTDNTQCVSCKGTGKKVHTTSADIMEIPMPRRPEDMVDVSNISAYVPFPGNVMEFLDKYADKMKKEIMRMMFNSESMLQTKFNTATEADIDMDSVYDTLSPFGDKYSETWMFFVKLSILYMSYSDVVIWHKFPSDLKLKSLAQLLSELKTANDSGASSYVRESINNDIADIIYADDQEERAKLAIKNKHFPFSGKTDFEIQNIILNNLTTQYKQVLYANFDSIFDDLENEQTKFYELAYVKQKELITAKVDDIIAEIKGSEARVLDLKVV